MRLTEVETRLEKHPLNRPDLYHHEVALLIRAVRQLGKAVLEVREEHRDSQDRNYNECDREQCGWCELLDPDVLELLNETD